MITVFGRVGYTQGGPPAGSWDVLWSHQYPFLTLPPETWKNLKPHQKINHFPGSGCFTSKPRLATLPYSFIPKAFQLPKQAEEFKKEVSLRSLLPRFNSSLSLSLSHSINYTIHCFSHELHTGCSSSRFLVGSEKQ